MQVNIGEFISNSLSTEQRLGRELVKGLGLSGFEADGLSLWDMFGAPGNSANSSSAARDIEQIRGWNHTAILAKALQFAVGSVGVFCPQDVAIAVAAHHGEEYEAASRFTGTEQFSIPADWVQAPRKHRVSKLMQNPHPWCDGAQFLFQLKQQVEAHGVCHLLVLPNQDGLPTQIHVIPKAAINPVSPSRQYPEGSFNVGNLSRLGVAVSAQRQPESYHEMLLWLSNKQYSAKYVIQVGLPSIVYSDDFINFSSALADSLDTDTQIHQSRRKTLSKQMTTGPRLEVQPGVDLQASEVNKLLEEFELTNQGPDNQGRAWMPPKGISVKNDSHSAREMEYTNSANQSRDHILGQRLWPAAMLGLGNSGSYSQIVAIIKGTTRLVIQPIMRIISGQITIGLQRYFRESQRDFAIVIQAASIDDPEIKLRERDLSLRAGSMTTGEWRKVDNLEPWGDERDNAIAGTLTSGAGNQPGAAAPGVPGLKVPEVGAKGGDIGPATPGGESPNTETSPVAKSSDGVFGSLTRQQFVRNHRAVMDTLQQLESGKIREKLALATLKTLGLSQEQAREFVDSIKDPEAAGATPEVVKIEDSPSGQMALKDWSEDKHKRVPKGDERGGQFTAFITGNPNVTETDKFTEWFGDSKTVNHDGNPIVLFHGTDREFTVFDNPYAKEVDQANIAMFSTNPEYAAAHVAAFDKSEQRILPVYVKAENPLDLTHIPAKGSDATKKIIRAMERAGVEMTPELTAAVPIERDVYQVVNRGMRKRVIQDALRAAGIDSVKMNDERAVVRENTLHHVPGVTWVVFDSSQVKSATGNTGEFSGESKDIRKCLTSKHPEASWQQRMTINWDERLRKLKKRRGEPVRGILQDDADHDPADQAKQSADRHDLSVLRRIFSEQQIVKTQETSDQMSL